MTQLSKSDVGLSKKQVKDATNGTTTEIQSISSTDTPFTVSGSGILIGVLTNTLNDSVNVDISIDGTVLTQNTETTR
jgi:hypothetical protein